jgi:hypothetical protein
VELKKVPVTLIKLDTKNQVVVCGDGNGGTFPVAIDLVS